MRKNTAAKPGLMDLWLFLPVLLLTLVGIWLVYDSSYARTVESAWTNMDSWYLAKRQAIFAVVGIVTMLAASRIRVSFLSKIAKPFLFLSILSLILLFPFGYCVNGAVRWYKIGPLTIQPSEITKLVLVVYLAGFLSQGKKVLHNIDSRWALPIGATLLIIGLIYMQPDMGTAIAILAIALAMYFAAGARKRHLFAVMAILVLCGATAVHLAPYRMGRVKVWQDPWQYRYGEGYQIVHSLIALGRGGVVGAGLCEGLEKLYIPAASTDFVFSTVGEETGLVGSLIMLGIFIYFVYRGLFVAQNAKNTFAGLLAVGITAMIGIQALVNVAVVTSSIPATGVTLPFISYGGSSLFITQAAVGVLLAVSRQTTEPQQ